MITENGYSKDPTIMPEGIVVTLGKDLMKDQGGAKLFLANFLETMNEEDSYWMHKCSNLPKQDFAQVYLSVMNRLWGRVYCGGMRKNQPVTGVTADGKKIDIIWNHIILAGPFEKCPFKRELKGFQGFRYCTKLF